MDILDRSALIVDSSHLIRYYHGILLKRLHYSVHTADSPDNALQVLKSSVPTLILTGLTFPHANGLDFVKTLKSTPRTKAVPVIAITALEDPVTRSACLQAGCAACLDKSSQPTCLFWTIQDVAEATPRQFIRINTSLKAIAGSGAENETAKETEYATSISEGGIFLRTLTPRQKDDIIPVSLFIDGREIRTKAAVVYTVSMEAGKFKEPGMGMRFVDISEEDRDFLRDFIHEELTTDLEFCMLNNKKAA